MKVHSSAKPMSAGSARMHSCSLRPACEEWGGLLSTCMLKYATLVHTFWFGESGIGMGAQLLLLVWRQAAQQGAEQRGRGGQQEAQPRQPAGSSC